mmetsp:Transcript_26398/g.87527  ORF Transcript_26398/g.87527 Transcript_26398/m.87527 type:complete len:222 (-) Transcript_26398:770-1435(-)
MHSGRQHLGNSAVLGELHEVGTDQRPPCGELHQAPPLAEPAGDPCHEPRGFEGARGRASHGLEVHGLQDLAVHCGVPNAQIPGVIEHRRHADCASPHLPRQNNQAHGVPIQVGCQHQPRSAVRQVQQQRLPLRARITEQGERREWPILCQQPESTQRNTGGGRQADRDRCEASRPEKLQQSVDSVTATAAQVRTEAHKVGGDVRQEKNPDDGRLEHEDANV